MKEYDCKFVIFGSSEGGVPVMFPMGVSHANVAGLLRSLLGEPVSAGHVSWLDGIPTAFGDSQSLGLKSRPEDTELLMRKFGIPEDAITEW